MSKKGVKSAKGENTSSQSTSLGSRSGSSIFSYKRAISLDALDKSESADDQSSESSSTGEDFASLSKEPSKKRNKIVKRDSDIVFAAKPVDAAPEHELVVLSEPKHSSANVIDLTDDIALESKASSASSLNRSKSSGRAIRAKSYLEESVSDPAVQAALRQLQSLQAEVKNLASSTLVEPEHGEEEDVIVLHAPTSETIKVHLRFEKNPADIVSLHIKSDDPLQKLFHAYKEAKRGKHSDSFEYIFKYDGIPLGPNQTAKDALVVDGAVIEAVRTGLSALLPLEEEEPQASGDHVALKFRGRDGTIFTASVPKGEKFKTITSKLIDKRKWTGSSVKFMFDGSILPAEQTPDDLDMEDDDIVEYSLA